MSEAKIFLKKYFMNILVGFVSGAFASVLVVLVVANSFIFKPYGKPMNYFLSESGVRVEEGGQKETIISQSGEKTFISQENLIVNAVKKANPAVVSIVITKDVPVIERYYE